MDYEEKKKKIRVYLLYTLPFEKNPLLDGRADRRTFSCDIVTSIGLFKLGRRVGRLDVWNFLAS